MNWFHSRVYVKLIIEVWRKHYNLIKPHSSLDYQNPAEFVDGWQKKLTAGARVSR
jgi:putative transposase